MDECEDFAVKKAVIIHQADYSLTRLLHSQPTFGDLNETKNDAVHARQLARGFGILEHDIIEINDMDIDLINLKLRELKEEFNKINSQPGNTKRQFLFVYCAGHGVADQTSYMVLNATSGNLFPIETSLRDLCNGKEMEFLTVFSVYDMCKDMVSNYPNLTKRVKKQADEDALNVTGRGHGR